MNKLSEYLSKHKMSQRAFAATVGVHHSVVSRFASGKAFPHRSTAVKIATVTNGAVPVDCWDSEAVS